jgi:hypothetical protein
MGDILMGGSALEPSSKAERRQCVVAGIAASIAAGGTK